MFATMSKHPTERVGTQVFAIEQERKDLQSMSVMYGSHMAMRAVLDRTLASRTQRVIGGSNHFSLNSHMGRYYEINFHDYLNDPNNQPDI